jgi:hypothetical protein
MRHDQGYPIGASCLKRSLCQCPYKASHGVVCECELALVGHAEELCADSIEVYCLFLGLRFVILCEDICERHVLELSGEAGQKKVVNSHLVGILLLVEVQGQCN